MHPFSLRMGSPSPRHRASDLSRGIGNIGIVCGRVVAIDLDADDPRKAKAWEQWAAEHLGATPFKRVGRAPRFLLLYRPAESIPSIKIGSCIEVLSGGRQFVAFGSHPLTSQPYHWLGPSPETAKIDDLPVITNASLQAFAEAVAKALPTPIKALSPIGAQTRKSNQQARQGDLLGAYDARIVLNDAGLVVDGREAFLAKLTAAEYAKDGRIAPDDLAHRVFARFSAQADLARPKGNNPRLRWSFKDALTKARSICRRPPHLKPPRRSRKGHPASHLNAWRRPGFWTVKQRDLHFTEVRRRISTPAVIAVSRAMIDAVDLANGF
jgi:Bifunctional DNA primase/polymerase, N-terminal